MTIRNLDKLLHPRSVAIVGASSRAGTLGQRVLENMLDGAFDGPVFTVNPKQVELDGDWWVPSVTDLPVAPDLAIIVTPASTVPDIIAELGAKGTRLAIVISSGFHEPALRQAILDAAQPHLLRIIGPNCLGVMMPHARVNGSFAQAAPRPGGLALVSQSGALVTSMIDWANERDVGFSGIVSLGDAADADFGDLIDLFAADPARAALRAGATAEGEMGLPVVRPLVDVHPARADRLGEPEPGHEVRPYGRTHGPDPRPTIRRQSVDPVSSDCPIAARCGYSPPDPYSTGSRDRLLSVLSDHGIEGLEPAESWAAAQRCGHAVGAPAGGAGHAAVVVELDRVHAAGDGRHDRSVHFVAQDTAAL